MSMMSLIAPEDGRFSRAVPHKENKGILGSVFKDATRSKTNQGTNMAFMVLCFGNL